MERKTKIVASSATVTAVILVGLIGCSTSGNEAQEPKKEEKKNSFGIAEDSNKGATSSADGEDKSENRGGQEDFRNQSISAMENTSAPIPPAPVLNPEIFTVAK